jgi:hypothetical protein
MSAQGRKAAVTAIGHRQALNLLDLTNSMIPDPEKPVSFKLDHEISPPEKLKHFSVGRITKEQLEEIKKSKTPPETMPHKVSFQSEEKEVLFRTFATKYFTEMRIIYEVADVSNISEDEKEFYKTVIDEFVKAYRWIGADYRPRFFEDYDEPKWIRRFVSEFDQADQKRSEDERFAVERDFRPLESQAVFRFDDQPSSTKDPSAVTDGLTRIFASGTSISAGREFLDMARHAALHIKNFKFALVEAFIGTENVVSKILKDDKLKKGVSASKLKDFETEVSISYKLNVELPMCLENVTQSERQIIGDVDKVRAWRNDVVHRGKVPTEAEAKFAVDAVSKLFEMLENRGFGV